MVYSNPKVFAGYDDQNKIIREISLRNVLRFLKLRVISRTYNKTFKIPTIYLVAAKFYHMMKQQNVEVTSIPTLYDVTNYEIFKATSERNQILSRNVLVSTPGLDFSAILETARGIFHSGPSL